MARHHRSRHTTHPWRIQRAQPAADNHPKGRGTGARSEMDAAPPIAANGRLRDCAVCIQGSRNASYHDSDAIPGHPSESTSAYLAQVGAEGEVGPLLAVLGFGPQECVLQRKTQPERLFGQTITMAWLGERAGGAECVWRAATHRAFDGFSLTTVRACARSVPR